MSMLSEVLALCLPDELDRLRHLKLRGKEKLVMDFHLENISRPEIDFPLSDEISSSHLHKIQSVLFRKVLERLSSDDVSTHFRWLMDHKGHDLFIHYAKIILKKAKQKPGSAQFDLVLTIASCYTALPIHYHISPFGNLILETIEKIGDREHWLKYKVTIGIKKAVSLKMKNRSQIDVWMEAATPILDELKALEPGIFEYPEVRTEYHLQLAEFHGHFTYNYDEAQLHLDEALNHASACSDPDQVKLRVWLKKAEIYYFDSQYDKSFKILRDHLNQIMGNLISFWPFYAKLVITAIITENIPFARKVLHQEASMKYPGVGNYLLRNKLYLISGELDEAAEANREASIRLNKQLHFQYDVEIRYMETVYFVLKRDYPFALDLIRKHLKFLNSKGHNKQNSNYVYFFYLLQAMILFELDGKEFPEDLVKEYELFQTTSFVIFGVMLRKVREQIEGETGRMMF